MKQLIEATRVDGEVIEPRHVVEVVCKTCGYDLTPEELEADTCADCGADLELKQSVAIEVTTKPIGTKVWGQ